MTVLEMPRPKEPVMTVRWGRFWYCVILTAIAIHFWGWWAGAVVILAETDFK